MEISNTTETETVIKFLQLNFMFSFEEGGGGVWVLYFDVNNKSKTIAAAIVQATRMNV